MLQAEITNEFLKANINGRSGIGATEKTSSDENPGGKSQQGASNQSDNSGGSVPAQFLNVAGMNTRGGWKLFINVQVNGRTIKLFGSRRELGQHVAAAGFAGLADHVNEGTMLNLPCRVITKPSANGKYLNIERVFPLKPLQVQRRERP